MAQYGKNFYGASYYGMRGTFAGEYTSEEIYSGNPLTGPLVNTTTVILPISIYHYDDPIFIYSHQPDKYTYGGKDYAVIKDSNSIVASIIGSEFSFEYLKDPAFETMNVSIETYIDGNKVYTHEETVDLSGEPYVVGTYNSPPLLFGDQHIKITHGEGSTEDMYIGSFRSRTTDVKVEVRAKTGKDGVFTQWEMLDPEKQVVAEIPNGFYLTSNTPDFNGKDYYQFKVTLGSSDDKTSPIVKKCKFSSGESSNYSRNGQFRMRIDLGEDVDTLKSLTYSSQKPEGTNVSVRTRTIGSEPFSSGSWTSWSAPYSDSQKRVRLKSNNLLSSQNPILEYIITPVIDPQKEEYISLLSWMRFLATQHVTDQNTKIIYEVLDKDLVPLTYVDDLDRFLEFESTESGKVSYDMFNVANKPIRFKIILMRNQGALSSPVVDMLEYWANVRYRQFKAFDPDLGYESYISAVYGNNTGVVELTYGDTFTPGDGSLVTPNNLSFTLPTPIGATEPIQANYSIETSSDTFGKYRAGEELNLYWKSQSQEINKNILTSDAEDILIAQARAWPENNLSREEANLFKHYQYNRGYIIYPNTVSSRMTNIFSPPLEAGQKHSYHLENGWLSPNGLTNKNDNLSVEWKSNSNSNISEISESNGSRIGGILTNDTIYINVTSSDVLGEVPWVSEEKIFETVLNENGRYEEKIITLTGNNIPEIDPEVSIDTNPYKTYIIHRSVYSGGKLVSEDRVKSTEEVNGKIYEYPMIYHGDDSFESKIIERAPILRVPSHINESMLFHFSEDEEPQYDENKGFSDEDGSIGGYLSSISKSGFIDTLPHSRVLSVEGIYRNDIGPLPDSPSDRPASYYVQGVDFRLVDNKIDWSIAYDDSGELLPGRAAPSEGETYYVTYTYNAVKKLYVSFRCRYKEYETSKSLWTSNTLKQYTGRCTPGHDFRSDKLPSKLNESVWGAIPHDVDKDTLFYTIHNDNIWINTFLDGDVVVGTLRDRIPSLNWFPTIHNGYYYVEKDEYYLFTEPMEFVPKQEDMERAINAKYKPGRYGNGIFLEEGTTNAVLNSGFDKQGESKVIFSDSFIRVVE